MAPPDTIAFLPFDGDPVIPDWNLVLDQDLSGIWLIRLPNLSGLQSARGWVIAFVTKNHQVYTLFPMENIDSLGATHITFKPISDHKDMEENKAFSAMIGLADKHYGRAVVQGTKILHVLKTAENSGLGYYRLKDGRGESLPNQLATNRLSYAKFMTGLRFWISWALFEMAPHILEPRGFDFLYDVSLHQMRYIMLPDQDRPTKVEIAKGLCTPHKITKTAWDNWKACDARNVYITAYGG
jgi:hypothetical protein